MNIHETSTADLRTALAAAEEAYRRYQEVGTLLAGLCAERGGAGRSAGIGRSALPV